MTKDSPKLRCPLLSLLSPAATPVTLGRADTPHAILAAGSENLCSSSKSLEY